VIRPAGVPALGVLAFLLTLHPWIPVAALAGGALVFVLPGVAATEALFGRRALTYLERIVLAPALSLATVVLGGLVLAAMGIRLTSTAWGGLCEVVTGVLWTGPYLLGRRGQVPATAAADRSTVEQGSAFPAAQKAPAHTRGAVRARWNLALLGVALVVLGLGSWIGIRSAVHHTGEPFTALSALPYDDPGAKYQVRPITLAVDCEEAGLTAYRLHVEDGSDVRNFNIELYPGEVWKQQILVQPASRMTAELFLGDSTTPYRTVFIVGKQS
jgi:hypothetical protein